MGRQAQRAQGTLWRKQVTLLRGSYLLLGSQELPQVSLSFLPQNIWSTYVPAQHEGPGVRGAHTPA